MAVDIAKEIVYQTSNLSMSQRNFMDAFHEDMKEFEKWSKCTCCKRHMNGRPFDAVDGGCIELVAIDHILQNGERCTAFDDENGCCIPVLHFKRKYVFSWQYTPKSKPVIPICLCNCRQRMRAIQATYATVHCQNCV